MAVVWIPSLMRSLTEDQPRVEVQGGSVREVIEELEIAYPGTRERICDGDVLRAGIAVSVDGIVVEGGLRQGVGPHSEIHFVVAVSGG
jgi:hypothetical protein